MNLPKVDGIWKILWAVLYLVNSPVPLHVSDVAIRDHLNVFYLLGIYISRMNANFCQFPRDTSLYSLYSVLVPVTSPVMFTSSTFTPGRILWHILVHCFRAFLHVTVSQ